MLISKCSELITTGTACLLYFQLNFCTAILSWLYEIKTFILYYVTRSVNRIAIRLIQYKEPHLFNSFETRCIRIRGLMLQSRMRLVSNLLKILLQLMAKCSSFYIECVYTTCQAKLLLVGISTFIYTYYYPVISVSGSIQKWSLRLQTWECFRNTRVILFSLVELFF